MAREGAGTRRRFPIWARVVLAVAVLLVAAVAWIGIRGLIAKDQLEGAIPLFEQLRDSIADKDKAAVQSRLDAIGSRAETARDLTSDPIWRAAEVIPFAGPNLAAMRRSAAVIDTVVNEALPPLAGLAGDVSISDLLPRGGTIDLPAVTALRGALAEAAPTIAAARAEADSIDTGPLIPQLRDAVLRLVELVDQGDALIGTAATAAEILPDMAGGDGPRDYLLLVQNDAEVRSGGGLPGAVALIHAENGRLELRHQTSATAMGRFNGPVTVTPLVGDEERLFGENLVRFMHNVTLTPNFARSGEIARAMWAERFGEQVDGVIGVDPVALSYLLAATDPLQLPDGETLTADSIVATLLSDSYARFSDPREQDAYFGAVARAAFSAIVSGDLDASKFLYALGRAASEHRVLLWSTRADEQQRIDGSPVAGDLPVSDAAHSAFGVYLNDNTQSKMSWYLRSEIAIGSAQCRNDGRPYAEVRVTLRSTAPADAATSLPDYVIGGGNGTEPGQMMNTTYLYAPAGAQIYEVDEGESAVSFISGEDGGLPVAGYTTILDPGETVQLTYRILLPPGAPVAFALEHTPTAFDVPVEFGAPTSCPQF